MDLPIAVNPGPQPALARGSPLPLAGATPEEVAVALGDREPRYRARQVLAWVHKRGAKSLADMTDLPKLLRERRAGDLLARTTAILARHPSDDRTVKLLVGLADGESVEAVLIPEGDRWTLCVSTQVGCGMACRFCATGTMGLRRSLTAAEIVEQALHARDELAGESPDNLVFMGMGEPLANWPALRRALEVLNAPWGTGIGARRMTVSTIGFPERIRDLATLGLEVNLAISLHAPDDDLRTALVPPNKGVGIRELLDAARDFHERTGRRVTLEYVLLAGVNDSPDQARRLAERVRSLGAFVNLIPMNPVAGLPDRASDPATVQAFRRALRAAGVECEIRRQRGDDIAAACGQLRLAAAPGASLDGFPGERRPEPDSRG
ncbi:MAG: 23S rRNA (adenine(2503)-C(2))-methyltransferase RlmN [Planctomycetales bacterium]|nr:23S rRNA (adenine(2503)-C(2))-methyltransferase RlmN [Planctomycetales bacterium]